jgi:hypothetical protein
VKIGEKFLACYRQATNHVSGDGRIETCLIDRQMNVSHRQHIFLANVDLRDPKVSEMPDGRLILIAYARHRTDSNKTTFSQSMYWTSQDGKTWASGRYFGPRNWWLWRIRWHNRQSFGLAYNRQKERVDLWAGHPQKGMSLLHRGIFSKEKHGKGYPNESDLWFESDQLHVVLRRDADTFSAVYGSSAFPYSRWNWKDLGCYVGGPNSILVNNSEIGQSRIVAGRSFSSQGLRTTLWELTNQKSLELIKHLPSNGDNSYPGMVYANEKIWVLYYSSHIDQETRVYLAQLTMK